MEKRIGLNKPRMVETQKKCCVKSCRKPLTEVTYEWNWFIQDSNSTFDGEQHHVSMCRECYQKLEETFVGHVERSNSLEGYLTYGGDISELEEREKERIEEGYLETLQTELSS